MTKIDLILEQLDIMLEDANSSLLYIEDYLKVKDPINYKEEDAIYNRYAIIVLENVKKMINKIKDEERN